MYSLEWHQQHWAIMKVSKDLKVSPYHWLAKGLLILHGKMWMRRRECKRSRLIKLKATYVQLAGSESCVVIQASCYCFSVWLPYPCQLSFSHHKCCHNPWLSHDHWQQCWGCWWAEGQEWRLWSKLQWMARAQLQGIETKLDTPPTINTLARQQQI